MTLASWRPDEVGHHDEGAGRPDVDGDDAALARVDVEEGRLAPALGLAGGALEHRAFPNQRAHQQADGAAPRAHEAREVGARDRLVGPNQVQRDAAVDRARGAPGGDAHGSAARRRAFVLSAFNIPHGVATGKCFLGRPAPPATASLLHPWRLPLDTASAAEYCPRYEQIPPNAHSRTWRLQCR